MDAPENDVIGELLRRAAEEETGHRRIALERAGHEAPRWPEEAGALADARRPLTELRSVGPWVAERIAAWLDDPPPAPEPDETRRGYLTWAKVRRVLADDPSWETAPHGDLQVHSTASDGALPLDEMAEAARTLGRAFIASTDHSKSLQVAKGMDEERLREHAQRIDAINATYAEHGVAFRVLRSIEMDVFDAGEGDMDPDALAELDLVLGAFHSKLRVREDGTERYLAALRNPTITSWRTRPRGCTGGGRGWSPTGRGCSTRPRAWVSRSSWTPRRVGRISTWSWRRSPWRPACAGSRWGATPTTPRSSRACPSRWPSPRSRASRATRILNYRSVDEVRAWAQELRSSR